MTDSSLTCREGEILIDSHIHLHEYGNEVSKYCGSSCLRLIAVSDDLESSKRTIELGKKCWNVVPAVGIHPWSISEGADRYLDQVLELAREARFVGEVGLDKKFVPQTYERQLTVFREFLKVASEHGKGVSVHAAGAWSDVLRELERHDIKVAIIHWYTGPTDLLSSIRSLGYYIGVNPAIKIQRKMREVVKAAPLEMLLTESDGPYNYRGMNLGPELISETIGIIAELKGVSEADVTEAIKQNFKSIMKELGINLI